MAYTEHTYCPNCFKPSYKSVCPSCFFDRNAYLQQQAASHHLPLFTVLDKGYILGRVLGEGSFAIVYAAIREKDLLPCAVKEYYPHDLAQRGLDGKTVNPKRNQEQLNTWQNRFIQEGELLRCCYDYPSVESGVVRYMGMVKQHGTAYLVMERLNGDNLGHYLNARRTLSGEAICLWLKPLLETLQKLHAKEIYHRDISPNNIFLRAPDYPVLMDFGLAREGARDEVLKSSTLGAGTFIAPEQVSGGYCDQRTDLYALGAVIYLCLHGEAPPPVEARRQGAQLKQLAQPSAVNAALERVANRCLQLDLQFRPQNAAQLLAELAPFWATSPKQTGSARQDFRTIIPDQAQSQPPLNEQQPQPPKNQTGNPAPPSSSRFKTFLKLAFWAGLVYGGFFVYQRYAEEQARITRQERRSFAKAKTIADFKKYLSECQICEEKKTASDKIVQLEQEQKKKQEQQKLKKQEHQAYLAAETINALKNYLATCQLCLDKEDAEAELRQLEEQAQAEAQTQAQPSAKPQEPSLVEDVINTVTKPIVDTTKQVVEEIKKPLEEAVTKSAEELKREQKAQMDKIQRDLEAELKKAGMRVRVQEQTPKQKPDPDSANSN